MITDFWNFGITSYYSYIYILHIIYYFQVLIVKNLFYNNIISQFVYLKEILLNVQISNAYKKKNVAFISNIFKSLKRKLLGNLILKFQAFF